MIGAVITVWVFILTVVAAKLGLEWAFGFMCGEDDEEELC